MTIIVDAYGGDNAPVEILKGCAMAVADFGVDIILTGSEAGILAAATENNISLTNMTIVDAPDVIAMEDHPNAIMKEKKNCSMAVGLRLLAEGKGDGFVTAGSTGAVLMGGTFIVKRIKGIKRPALAPIMPKSEGIFMLIDSGANTDVRPEVLCQFAQMGSVYMEKVMGVASARIGLANVGTEDTKGDELRKATFPILRSMPSLNFIGNIEARDIAFDACDVVVADGFTGNIILKMYEGVASALMAKFKAVFAKSLKNKLAAAMVYNDLKAMKKQLDYTEYGGAPLLGVQKPVFKAHGSSKAKTFRNAIGQLIEFIRADCISTIGEQIAANSTSGEE